MNSPLLRRKFQDKEVVTAFKFMELGLVKFQFLEAWNDEICRVCQEFRECLLEAWQKAKGLKRT